MSQASILLVEDDASVVDLVKGVLEEEHYGVTVATSAFQAEGVLLKCRPDLVILDRNLPDKDGMEFCKALRASPATRGVPVLFLTSRKGVTDKVLGLEAGGDDYLAKPFSVPELVARVRALLRRAGPRPEASPVVAVGPLEVNLESREARAGGKPLRLTGKELDLLRAFLERPGRVLTRQFLLTNVWGYDMDVELTTKAVDWMVMSLRRKLGRWGSLIETVKGHGYKLNPPEANP